MTSCLRIGLRESRKPCLNLNRRHNLVILNSIIVETIICLTRRGSYKLQNIIFKIA